MGLYVSDTDFLGQDKVATDKFTTPDLDTYIDKYEVRYLQDLLGCDLYTDFALDFAINGTMPTDPKFQEIWNPICIDEQGCAIIRSEGIRDMLIQFVYWEYLRDSKVKNNIGGPNINLQVNSEGAKFHETNIYTNYNLGIESFKAIQWTICENPNGYNWDNYNGQPKRANSFI